MFRRLILLAVILFAALALFCILGVRAIDMHAQGLEARRAGEFVEVAHQIRQDMKRKLDALLQSEQQRPFTDYQHLYMPDNVLNNTALLVSPIADRVSNGMAYGYFQIDPDGRITSPHIESPQAADPEVKQYLDTVEKSLLPVLGGRPALQARRIVPASKLQDKEDYEPEESIRSYRRQSQPQEVRLSAMKKTPAKDKGDNLRRDTYRIEIDESQQPAQVITQSRAAVEYNMTAHSQMGRQPPADPQPEPNAPGQQTLPPFQQQVDVPQSAEIVQVRIEPFVPMILPAAAGDKTIFNGDVFLLRHVQIEQRHFLQGFRLNQDELAAQIRESALRLIRRDMGFDISLAESPAAAHTAVLDFGFGDLVLNLFETNPGRLGAQIARLRRFYFAVIGVVAAAVTLALAALGQNLHAQLRLARKKDDFISAVSHELRTPLTSIRMYTEMLENDWVRSEDKRRRYYANMRQETERLSRLIENVLDFSRIQRKRKQYRFQIGSLNDCVEKAVAMFRPCAKEAGFEVRTQWADLPELAFDRDAVTQIVINLLDNAVKYAAGPEKLILVRTLCRKDHVLLEVEDRGPGIPRRFHKKVFEEFYRCSDESTREAPGTGLGLALVRRFAQAHEGFVAIAAARPRGAVLRVAFPLPAPAD